MGSPLSQRRERPVRRHPRAQLGEPVDRYLLVGSQREFKTCFPRDGMSVPRLSFMNDKVWCKCGVHNKVRTVEERLCAFDCPRGQTVSFDLKGSNG